MTTPHEGQAEIPIVLTATVVPAVTGAALADPAARLAEYAKAVQFYVRHAPVIFLENSSYPLERHAEFRETARLQVKRFPPSASPERGKGHQEFEMLDAWLAAETRPPARWLKITGRYQILNIQSLLSECRQGPDSGLIIDQVPRVGLARTYLFGATTSFYRERLAGIYRECDDRSGAWIERILFRKLRDTHAGKVRSFKTQPRLFAVAGTAGSPYPRGWAQWRLKQTLRRINRLFDQTYLWYSR